MMMNNTTRIVKAIVILLINTFLFIRVFSSGRLAANAAYVTGWTAPQRLSQSYQFAYTPFLVADSAGTVHAVWSANAADPARKDFELDTIFYNKIQNSQVGNERDIFVARFDYQARINRLRIDNQDNLHLLFVERPGIVYARTHVSLAEEARSWSSFRINEDAYIADFAIGIDNSINLVYVVTNIGIFFIRSSDNGETWSVPTTVEELDSDTSSGSVRIECDTPGTLHTTWGFNTRELRWNPAGVAYSRSTDGGVTWQKTLEVKEEDNLSNIGITSDGVVHLVWDNKAGTTVGRGHAWSKDGGITWARIERIFPGYQGQTLWPVMGSDSSGNLFLVTAANSPTADRSQIHFSQWSNSEWNQPTIVSGGLFEGESPSLAVALGNQIYIAWFSYDPNDFGVWFTTARSSSPALTPRVIASPTTISLQPTSTLINPLSGESEKMTPDGRLFSGEMETENTNPNQPAIVGIFLSIVVIGSIGIVILIRKRTRY